MGREATAVVHWQGSSGDTRVLLETTELILRGALKGRVPRDVLKDIRVAGEVIEMTTPSGPLRIELGAKMARSWAAALQRPPPSLAERLGLLGGKRAYVAGEINDAALQAAVGANRVERPETAALLIAVIRDGPGIASAVALALRHPALPIWCVYPKGKAADPGDATIRAQFRAAGRIDVKTSGVSGMLTATRYDTRVENR